jgi:hypothetical protein
LGRALELTGFNMKTENEITVVLIKDEGNKLRVLYHILVDNIAKILPCDKTFEFWTRPEFISVFSPFSIIGFSSSFIPSRTRHIGITINIRDTTLDID